MAADITIVLNAMRAVLEAAYPTVPVLVKARGAGEPGKIPACGWMPGDPVPAHVLSELEAETVDSTSNFETMSLSYPVVWEAVFTGAPQPWDDIPEVRERRIEVADLFYRNDVSGFPANVFDARMTMLPVYAGNPEESVMITAIKFNYTLGRPRPGTA